MGNVPAVPEPGQHEVSRAEFLARRKRIGPARMDALFAPDYDTSWGNINPLHRSFVRRLADLTPPGGLLLDAACGTGKYWPQLVAAGRSARGLAGSPGWFSHCPAAVRDHLSDR